MIQTKNKIYTGGILHPGQVEIAKQILFGDYFYHTISCSRQFGKSYLGTQLLLYYAINNPGSELMYTTPVYSQASKIFKDMLKGIKGTDIIKEFNRSENSVILANNSEIYFKSIQIPDNLRTYSIDYMFCDEAAQYKEEVFTEVLRPMLTVKGKKCFFLSTPKGKNWFYKMYQLAKENKRYTSFKKTYKDNPYANLEEIEDAKKTLPNSVFLQEYEAEFIDDVGDVFVNIKKCCKVKFKEPDSKETYFAGIDFGRQDDYTVLTILNQKGEIVFIYRDNQKQWSTIIDNIVRILNKYKPRYTLAEVNSIGDVLFEMLQKKYKNVEPFYTSNDSKADIIELLIRAFQDELISIVDYEVLINELQDFSFSYSRVKRKIVYKARTGHDDTVISLALANKAKESGIMRGSYCIR